MNRNLFTKVIMAVLILMFLGGIALGAADVLSAEGQEPPAETYKQSVTQLPAGSQAIIQYLNARVDDAKSGQAKLDVRTKISVDDDSISFGENGEMLEQSVLYAKESILKNLAGRYPETSVDFGRDFSGAIWNLQFEPQSISRTESKEEKDLYIFNITFPDESDPFGMSGTVNESFHMGDSQAVLDYLWESYAGFAAVNNVKVGCTGLEIEAEVNRLTDQINHVTYTKKLNVEAEITFLGELSAAGTRKMSFTLEEKTSFNFTWANLSLSPETLKLKKGDIKVIAAYITASGDITVKWTSSNPAVAEVDSEGYVKARQISAEPVIITAEFEFLGKKYTDTCEVTVTVPVKSVKLSEKKLSLAAGAATTLGATVQPGDATIKDVLWFSKDPAVAAVDADGRVTGIAPGDTEIYVLSKDGYYKISCAVTVTG